MKEKLWITLPNTNVNYLQYHSKFFKELALNTNLSSNFRILTQSIFISLHREKTKNSK